MAELAMLNISSTERAVIAVIKCEKVGAREAQILEADLRVAAATRSWRLVIDMADVTLLASMGLGMLVTMHKECAAQGGKLAICGLSSDIRQLLKITHLEKIFKLFDSREAAVKAVG